MSSPTRAAVGTRSRTELLRPELGKQDAPAGDIAARPGQIGDQPQLDRILCGDEHDRNRSRGRFGGKRRRSRDGDNHRHLTAYQLGGQRRQPIVFAFGKAVFDRNVATLDVTGVG
jgi:hypothetical protein